MSPQVTGVWCVVVAKDFARAKSRLSSVLDAASRAELSRRMFVQVVALADAQPGVDGVLVATDSEVVEQLAQTLGARVVRDVGDAHDAVLSEVVDRALKRLRGWQVPYAVVLMSDLPLLDAGDVRALLDGLRDADAVIAPDRGGAGTNALALRLDSAWTTCFGRADSFAAHQAQLLAMDLRVEVLEREGLAFDVDTPDDLAKLPGTARSF